jgi:hypothetical protein
MEKQIKHSFKGLNQDTGKSKFSNEYYFDALNIRLNSTDSQKLGTISNEKGNAKLLNIPNINIDYNGKIITYSNKILKFKNNEINYTIQSGDQKIIAQCPTRDSIVFISTDNNGFDCIWNYDYTNVVLTLLYLRNLNLSPENPIQIINNFENEKIDKIYWVDSKHQIRFLNLKHSILNGDSEELIDVSQNILEIVGKYKISFPNIVEIVSGGSHTAGMIQYAYNLYSLNAAQTKIGPLSKLISLDNQEFGGGDLNEIVNSTPIVEINNIDSNYTHIKIYAVKYTSFNQIPSISLIVDQKIPDSKNIQIADSGTIINTISLEEFLFLGSDIIIPENIVSKDSVLFLANYKEINFEIDLDTRAYSFNSLRQSKVYKDIKLDINSELLISDEAPVIIINDGDYDNIALIKHDSINLNYDSYKFQKNGTTLGGEGKYLKYEQSYILEVEASDKDKYFKDDEIYRLGISFYNNYGQSTLPNWIADFKSTDGNLRGRYNTLKVTLKNEFFTWLNTQNFESEYYKPVGYKILVAERTTNDKTILSSGLLSTMMINDKSSKDVQYSKPEDKLYVRDKADTIVKMPNILIRNYNQVDFTNDVTMPLRSSQHLAEMNTNSTSNSPYNSEIQRSGYVRNAGTAYVVYDGFVKGRCYQFNSMMQMYSPEVLFGENIKFPSNLKLKIKGRVQNNTNNCWARNYDNFVEGGNLLDEGTVTGAISPYFNQSNSVHKKISNQGAEAALYEGLISQAIVGSRDRYMSRVSHVMIDRKYGVNNDFTKRHFNYFKSSRNTEHDIYNKPEITERGQNAKNYNNDPNYRYQNNLIDILTDGNADLKHDGDYNRSIVSINSENNRCVTIVMGSNEETSHYDRLNHEYLGFVSVTGDNNGLIGELVKTKNDIYLSGIYGGNKYSDKRRTNYVEVGEYKNINSLTPTITINSPGDTFVNTFSFIRIIKADNAVVKDGVHVLEELVSVLCETTLDLKNRKDLSFQEWDTKFQPLYTEYHKYNKVYSQQPTLIAKRNLDYNIKKINNFDANIIATKKKNVGELIDSWSDISINEVMTLDGKYGAIKAINNFNDEIYAIQEQALARISINPRVQIQGNDGISVQLGTGQLLNDYNYISTTSGTLNKWSVISTPSGLYYYDFLNKSLMLFNNQLINLSKIKGMNSFFSNNTDSETIITDNPLIGKGITMGYDNINNDLFITFRQLNKSSFTLSYNELFNEFVSFYSFIPSLYVSKGFHFLTIPSFSENNVFKHGNGVCGSYYNNLNLYPSHVTLHVNPEADKDCIFNNLEYKSEIYINGVDQPTSTLTSIQIWNEYQNSGEKSLLLNSNLSRKFRNWRITLPRNANSRDRIRNPWVFLKLKFENSSNKNLTLHDMSVSYTT